MKKRRRSGLPSRYCPRLFHCARLLISVIQAEEAKRRGTPVTVESFKAWKIKFDKEMDAKRAREEDEKLRGLVPKEREEHKKLHTRPTGEYSPRSIRSSHSSLIPYLCLKGANFSSAIGTLLHWTRILATRMPFPWTSASMTATRWRKRKRTRITLRSATANNGEASRRAATCSIFVHCTLSTVV